MSLEATMVAPERALVVANEFSQNARRARREIGQLTIPTCVIQTHKDPRRTQDEIYKLAPGCDIVFSAGGDGTANVVLNTQLGEEGVELGLDNLPFVPLRAGNANDGATMINGKKSAAEILKEGRGISLHPLEISYEDRVRYALGYLGVGATAAASRRLNEIKNTANWFTRHSGIQFGREAWAVWATIGNYQSFKARLDEKATQEITDISILRGNRIAKLGRPHANLAEPEFEAVSTSSQGMAAALVSMLKMQRGKTFGDMLASMQATVETDNPAGVPIQYDGEVDFVPNGSRLSVGVSARAYRTVSTRL